MNSKLLNRLLSASRYLVVGFFMEGILAGATFAADIAAQFDNTSIEDIYVSFDAENARLNEVFSQLGSETGFSFAFNEKILNLDKRITLHVSRGSLGDVLREISRKSNLKFKRVDDYIHVARGSGATRVYVIEEAEEAQDISVSGKVVSSEDNETLPGVTVIIKGTSQGTVTDLNGEFRIDVPSRESVLVFSSVGFVQQEVVVGDRTSFNVSLAPDITALQEIVVVGYGEQKKVNLTGAVSTVSGDKLVNRPVTGTVDALQGVLPGVVVTKANGSPGLEDYEIQIRGLTSVNTNPVLVLINGVEGNIDDVRPEDIESISVLKDAASASIYGAKAAGGVILITTKSGKAGKLSVEFNSYYSVSRLGRTQEKVSSLQAAKMRNEADINAGGSASVTDEMLANIADPNIEWTPDPVNPNQYRFWGNYDYKDLVLEKFTPMISHNLAVSGGSEKTTYRISGTYYKNDGSIKIGPDENTRYSGRLNLNTELGKYFSLSNDLAYSNNRIDKPYTNTDGDFGIFAYVFTYPGITPLYDPNGHMAVGARMGAFDGRTKFYDFSYEKGIHQWEKSNARLNSTLTMKNMVKGLQLRVMGAIDANFDKEFQQRNPIYFYGIDGQIAGVQNSASDLMKKRSNSAFKEFRFLGDYDLEVKGHTFHLLGGYQYQDYRAESLSVKALNLVNKNLPDLNWASPDGMTIGDDISTVKFQSVFGRLNYNYKERYLVEADMRYDGSSKLDPSNRYELFPSASAAWRISNESWFDVRPIDELKLRGSFGRLGNAGALGNYDYIALLKSLNNMYLGINGTTPQLAQYVSQAELASKNITWETVETSDIGTDIGLFNNRLTITADYFIKRNKNMLAAVAYPSVIGIGFSDQNVGELKTWGWDASIGWRNNRGALSYWVNANIADAENELVEYLGATVVRAGTNRLLEGMPINSIYGYKTGGLFQSDSEVDAHAFQNTKTGAGDVIYIDQNGDGKINAGKQTKEDHGDLQYLGNSNPRYTFGLQGGFNVKGFDFMVFFQGVGKRVFLLDNAAIEPFWRPYFAPQQQHLDYWTPENTDASWPRLFGTGEHNFLPSDKWIQDAAYVRLKDIQVGYTLPEQLLSKAGITRLRFYVAGHDVWEATGVLDVIDPETPDQATFQYPFRRSYTVGVNLNF
jgi:TonB-linked SusC/RagA family outer membrane protein